MRDTLTTPQSSVFLSITALLCVVLYIVSQSIVAVARKTLAKDAPIHAQPWMSVPKLCLPFIGGTFVALVSMLTKANVQAVATLSESDNLSEPFAYISFFGLPLAPFL